jgi:SAM-dependent methyltransferase
MKYDASEIRALYDKGESVMKWMRAQEGGESISSTAIQYSYDVQAGSYVTLLKDPRQAELKAAIGRRLAHVIEDCKPLSLLEAGIGEATTLAPVLAACSRPPGRILGFDLSLSRLLYARRHLEGFNRQATLFTGALNRIPLPDASVDLVFTFHAVEPNRGREAEILEELLRVAARRVVMVEPSYELGSPATRRRIDEHGYVRGLPETLVRLGHPPTLVERFELDVNQQNEAAIIVVDKEKRPTADQQFLSPISMHALERRDDCWFCRQDGHAFPVIAGIPCLTVESAILASKLYEF